jgi:hypothetical protein
MFHLSERGVGVERLWQVYSKRENEKAISNPRCYLTTRQNGRYPTLDANYQVATQKIEKVNEDRMNF